MSKCSNMNMHAQQPKAPRKADVMSCTVVCERSRRLGCAAPGLEFPANLGSLKHRQGLAPVEPFCMQANYHLTQPTWAHQHNAHPEGRQALGRGLGRKKKKQMVDRGLGSIKIAGHNCQQTMPMPLVATSCDITVYTSTHPPGPKIRLFA